MFFTCSPFLDSFGFFFSPGFVERGLGEAISRGDAYVGYKSQYHYMKDQYIKRGISPIPFVVTP